MKLGVEKGRQIIFNNVDPISDYEKISVDKSLGRVLKEPVTAEENHPKYNISRFDGYALLSNDLQENAKLKVVEKSKLDNGECRRVETGCRIPTKADFVVMVEDVREKNGYIIIKKIPDSKNIIVKGSNIKEGQKIINKNSVIDEINIGVFPTLEREKVKVYRETKVGIIATGDEINPVNDVNSRILCELINKNGGYVESVSRPEDDKEKIEKNILDFLNSGYDLIITIGGTSKGKQDYVDDVVSDIGETLFDGIKMRPGKTFSFGKVRNTPVFSLSGNVTPCLIQAQLFLIPVLRYMSHFPKRERVKLKANETISAEAHKIMNKGARKILPGRIINEEKVEPVFGKYMTILPLLCSNCLMIVDENKDRIEKGEKVSVIPLKNSKL